MKKVILILTLCLAGCSSMSSEKRAENCAKGINALGFDMDPMQKAALYETLRNAGCMGSAPASQVDVRIQ